MIEFLLSNIEAILALIAGIGAFIFVRQTAKGAERLKQKEKDLEHAKDIRDRVDNDFSSVRPDYKDRGYRD